jgi:hypothetical protein
MLVKTLNRSMQVDTLFGIVIAIPFTGKSRGTAVANTQCVALAPWLLGNGGI